MGTILNPDKDDLIRAFLVDFRRFYLGLNVVRINYPLKVLAEVALDMRQTQRSNEISETQEWPAYRH